MPEFNVRADSVNVEQVMEQIRARIREKRGVDYTEEQVRELATVKLERLMDPRGVRSDLVGQFKRMQADIRNHGQVKWKHVMHLIRLLLSGIHVLREGYVQVDTGPHREQLLAIKNSEMPWDEVEAWRLDLHAQFDRALEETKLPERPDYERVNEFLVKARRLAVAEGLP